MQEARPEGTRTVGLHLCNTREDAHSSRQKADQRHLGKREDGWIAKGCENIFGGGGHGHYLDCDDDFRF